MDQRHPGQGSRCCPLPSPAALSASLSPGLSNDEIAEAMVLSPATAKTHVSRAMIKLGARDRAQLVVFAYQTGLVTPRATGQAPGLEPSDGPRWRQQSRPAGREERDDGR